MRTGADTLNKEELMIKCVVEGRGFTGLFTTRTLQSLIGAPREQMDSVIKTLISIRAFKKMEQSSRGALYSVSEGAIQKVKHYINANKEVNQLPQVDDLGDGLVWVKKANVKGMGNTLLKRFDKLLSGVR